MLSYRLSNCLWMHQQDSVLCGISLHVLAVECEVFIHSNNTLVAQDITNYRQGSVLVALVRCTWCNRNNSVQ